MVVVVCTDWFAVFVLSSSEDEEAQQEPMVLCCGIAKTREVPDFGEQSLFYMLLLRDDMPLVVLLFSTVVVFLDLILMQMNFVFAVRVSYVWNQSSVALKLNPMNE